MRRFVGLVVIAWCLGCNRAPAEPQSVDPEAGGAEREAGGAELTAEAEARPAAPAGPPVRGLRYWAEVSLSTEQFLAQAKESGLRIDHVVQVSSVTELLSALADHTAIVLAPGRYVFEDSNLLAEPEVQATLPDWSKLSPHYDGGEIHDLRDLAIIGAGPGPTVVLQSDGYAHALSFRSVHGVALHGLTIGHHPDQGWCRGGVVKVIEGANVLVSQSTLFGSGTEGLTLITVDGLQITDSVITNSSQSFSTISHSRGISYERVRVVGNDSDLLRGFAIHRSEVSLSDCTIADNEPLQWTGEDPYDLLFYVDGDYDMASWFVDDPPRAVEPERTRSTVWLRNTMVDGERVTRQLP